MTTGQILTFARLHDGVHPISSPAEVELLDNQLRVDQRLFSISEVQVSPRAGSADRFITLPNGSELQVPDASWLDRLPLPEQGATILPWLEARAWVAATSLVGIIAFAVWFWFAGLPYLAAFGARHMPVALEARLGRESLANLDKSEIFAPSEIDHDIERELRQRFSALAGALKDGQSYQLVFRRASVGPNAIALPGNLVVVTDDLVDLCTLDETAAVMAHELAHASERHVMRSYLADISLEALSALVWGRGSSTSVAVDAVPLSLLELGYSRELEQQADEGAFELLRHADLRPSLLGDALERLSNPDFMSDDERSELNKALASSGDAGAPAEDDDPTSGGATDEGDADQTTNDDVPVDDDDWRSPNPAQGESWSFLSTHPVTSERIARARAQR